ncbi:ABC transporter F family member 1 [Diplonema papillatum]|nr:ABC transporter F family member 1 [Diplonema papillatum]
MGKREKGARAAKKAAANGGESGANSPTPVAVGPGEVSKTGAVTNFQPPKYKDEETQVVVTGIDINYHGQHILIEQTLSLTVGHRYGLVGSNGCGKSTLLSVLGAGEIPVPKRVNLFHLREEVQASDRSVMDVVLEANVELPRLQAELDELQEREDQGEDHIAQRIEEIFNRMDELEADSAESRAASILVGLGFDHAMQLRPTSSFSGGWRMRVALAQALFLNPTCLLLDEPTNHLDIEACVWLERYLACFTGMILMVSHSQDFMNNVCTDIIRMHHGKLVYYAGGYDDYVSTRKEMEVNQMKKREKEQHDIAEIKDFVARFGHGTAKMVRQAQSKQKIIDKMVAEGLTPDLEKENNVNFEFPCAGKLPPPVVAFDDVAFKYPKMEKMLYSDVNFGVNIDSKICLVGPNGAGKTTLIKLMMGELEPCSGMVKRNQHALVAHFSQHSVDQLDMTVDPLTFMQQKFPSEKDLQVHRSWLGRFGISGLVQTQVQGTLSDGQKSRVVLALMARRNPHMLILDEPTNHLDMESIDELARALNKYEGCVVLISHDMRLIAQVCSQILIADNNTITKFPGDIAAYKKVVAKRVLATVTQQEKAAKKSGK